MHILFIACVNFVSGVVVGAALWQVYKTRIINQLQIKVEELEGQLGMRDARGGPAPRP